MSSPSRFQDYLALSKPRIVMMVLITVSVGFVLSTEGAIHWLLLLHTLFGVGLAAMSSSILNQVYEADTDARMPRTSNRPLPTGRLSKSEVVWFGLLTGTVSVLHLLFFVNVLTAALALLTLVTYVAIYTPLKRRSFACTFVGAIPGAMPPVLGWTGATGTVDDIAWVMFAMMFIWQFPHLLAIGWMYREQYADAGLYILPDQGKSGSLVGWVAVGYAALLIPISLFPVFMGNAGVLFLVVSLGMGLAYLLYSIRFLKERSLIQARRLLLFSLLYLPLVLGVLSWDYRSVTN